MDNVDIAAYCRLPIRVCIPLSILFGDIYDFMGMYASSGECTFTRFTALMYIFPQQVMCIPCNEFMYTLLHLVRLPENSSCCLPGLHISDAHTYTIPIKRCEYSRPVYSRRLEQDSARHKHTPERPRTNVLKGSLHVQQV